MIWSTPSQVMAKNVKNQKPKGGPFGFFGNFMSLPGHTGPQKARIEKIMPESDSTQKLPLKIPISHF